jgi:hypothetical protein
VIFDLDRETRTFGQTIQDLLDAVLPTKAGDDPEQRRLNVIRQVPWFVVRPGTEEKPGKIKLLHNGEHVADLSLNYRCLADQSGSFLAVRKSSFQLTSRQDGPPLLRIDFDHNAHTVPTAHWNVHAERGATSALLARCNRKHVGLLSKIHLPVGGPRYRPCLEDFLEMLIKEFNFDSQTGWCDAIREGRETWRTFQARVVVRDSPEAAADVLRQLSYQVEAPADGAPEPNTDVLRAR